MRARRGTVALYHRDPQCRAAQAAARSVFSEVKRRFSQRDEAGEGDKNERGRRAPELALLRPWAGRHGRRLPVSVLSAEPGPRLGRQAALHTGRHAPGLSERELTASRLRTHLTVKDGYIETRQLSGSTFSGKLENGARPPGMCSGSHITFPGLRQGETCKNCALGLGSVRAGRLHLLPLPPHLCPQDHGGPQVLAQP